MEEPINIERKELQMCYAERIAILAGLLVLLGLVFLGLFVSMAVDDYFDEKKEVKCEVILYAANGNELLRQKTSERPIYSNGVYYFKDNLGNRTSISGTVIVREVKEIEIEKKGVLKCLRVKK